MATKGNSNKSQKNGVRYVLATAATVMTLLGAQSLAFAGKSTSDEQETQTTVAVLPTTASLVTASVTTIPTETTQVALAATQVASPTTVVTATATTVKATTAPHITVAVTQPAPSTKSSR